MQNILKKDTIKRIGFWAFAMSWLFFFITLALRIWAFYMQQKIISYDTLHGIPVVIPKYVTIITSSTFWLIFPILLLVCIIGGVIYVKYY